ncbi:hypothetical protein JDW15_10380 [Aerococcaceae bacterium zg-ZJ1578]|nr:hypothetical protein [Aerococcaceae bacterium zg-1578]
MADSICLTKLQKKLHITDDLKSLFPEHARQILDLAIYLNLSHSNSLSHLADWCYSHYLPSQPEQLSSQRINDLLKPSHTKNNKRFLKNKSITTVKKNFGFMIQPLSLLTPSL